MKEHIRMAVYKLIDLLPADDRQKGIDLIFFILQEQVKECERVAKEAFGVRS